MPSSVPGVGIPGDPGGSCKASNAPVFKVVRHHFCHVVWARPGSRVGDYTWREYPEVQFTGATLS